MLHFMNMCDMDDLVSLVAFKKAIFSLRKRRFQYTREVKAWFLNFKIKLLNVVYVKLDNRAKGGHPPPPPQKKKYIKKSGFGLSCTYGRSNARIFFRLIRETLRPVDASQSLSAFGGLMAPYDRAGIKSYMGLRERIYAKLFCTLLD